MQESDMSCFRPGRLGQKFSSAFVCPSSSRRKILKGNLQDSSQGSRPASIQALKYYCPNRPVLHFTSKSRGEKKKIERRSLNSGLQFNCTRIYRTVCRYLVFLQQPSTYTY